MDIVSITNLPTGYIAYNINTISPSARYIDAKIFTDLQQMGLTAVRVEEFADKWRTDIYHPSVMAAQVNEDGSLTLRPDIFHIYDEERSNTKGHEDPRITLMKFSGQVTVVVSNVEVDGSDDPKHPKITTVLYKVKDYKKYPWEFTKITEIPGKDVQIEQIPDTDTFVRVLRPNRKLVANAGLGKIMVDIVTFDELQQQKKFEDAHFLEYPKEGQLLDSQKEGGNQIILLFRENTSKIGMLLLGHRATLLDHTIKTGDEMEDFEQNNVQYVATLAYIPDLGDLTPDEKVQVSDFKIIASTEDLASDVFATLNPKESRLKKVFFAGGIFKGKIYGGVGDAYVGAFDIPEWVNKILKSPL